jgi:hypothetical protein
LKTTNIEIDHGGKTALHYAAENSELSVGRLDLIDKEIGIMCLLDSENFM